MSTPNAAVSPPVGRASRPSVTVTPTPPAARPGGDAVRGRRRQAASVAEVVHQ
jgi:hypothetical protein